MIITRDYSVYFYSSNDNYHFKALTPLTNNKTTSHKTRLLLELEKGPTNKYPKQHIHKFNS